VSSFDAFVAEIRSTLPLPKFFMESPNRLEHIWEPLKMLSLCCNTEAQSSANELSVAASQASALSAFPKAFLPIAEQRRKEIADHRT
jgi:hypothetical protein